MSDTELWFVPFDSLRQRKKQSRGAESDELDSLPMKVMPKREALSPPENAYAPTGFCFRMPIIPPAVAPVTPICFQSCKDITTGGDQFPCP